MTTVQNIAKASVGNALTSAAANHVVAVAADIYDETNKGYQSEINSDLYAKVGQGSGGGGIADVTDNKQYVRTKGSWVELSGVSIEDTSDTTSYPEYW